MKNVLLLIFPLIVGCGVKENVSSDDDYVPRMFVNYNDTTILFSDSLFVADNFLYTTWDYNDDLLTFFQNKDIGEWLANNYYARSYSNSFVLESLDEYKESFLENSIFCDLGRISWSEDVVGHLIMRYRNDSVSSSKTVYSVNTVRHRVCSVVVVSESQTDPISYYTIRSHDGCFELYCLTMLEECCGELYGDDISVEHRFGNLFHNSLELRYKINNDGFVVDAMKYLP